MKLCARLIFTVVLLLFHHALFPQTVEKHIHNREQTWLGYFNQTRISNRFGFWLDVHYRQTDNFIDRPFQLLIRQALTYFIKDNIRVHVGYVLAEHFPAKGLSTIRPEHRGWQQIWWNQKYPGFSTLQWLRLEERFNKKITNDVLSEETTLTFRLRYNLSFFIPLKGKEIVAKTPFVAVMDEVFLNFGGNVVYNTFDQNRFFAGVGYQFNKHLNAQLGYMKIFQQEATGNNYISSDVVRLFFFHNLDLRKSNE